VVQALIDNLVERGVDPTRPRLFIIDGSKALSKAIRRTFGRHTPIQRCQLQHADFQIMPTNAWIRHCQVNPGWCLEARQAKLAG
jgi:hypothetical protein